MPRIKNEFDELKDLTEDYWSKLENNLDDQVTVMLKTYIPKLLPREMEQIKKNSPPQQAKTLVLLVGFSWEPLLQAVCHYRPEKLYLLLNAKYGGESAGVVFQKLEQLINKLSESKLIEKKPEIKPTEIDAAGAGPVEVFHQLTQIIKEEGEQPPVRGKESLPLVLDITGAKKNMVAAAFLFAALSGTAVSYVDFPDDAYSPEKRRPYGYRSKIALIDNPYTFFAMGKWLEVRQLYKQYNFNGAIKLVDEIKKSMDKGDEWSGRKYFGETGEKAVDRLLRVLECYECWESGNFNRASEIYEGIKGEIPGFRRPPDAVKILGGIWYEVQGAKFVKKPGRFYLEPQLFDTYICDELRRIERMIEYKEDYRAAFLRAAGLSEVVLNLWLLSLLDGEEDRKKALDFWGEADGEDGRSPNASKSFKKLTAGGTFKMKDLGGKNPPDITFNKGSKKIPRWWNSTAFFKDRGDRKGWKIFLDCRNKIAHRYYSIPEELAKDALLFARLNYESYRQDNRMPDSAVFAEIIPWPELCGLCGLKEILPPPVTGDE
ncbi:hypothetical protein [Desulforamulus putei]|uniref:CRISPR-associated protein (Cas_Cas02710) n=1 Tax=Desulforamulus putei DSM 12395 TaxID=1121429 RepID=A0A1M4SGT6_9FIRM|nr:hypothetical protein [Desulforamulus putei]SHE31443.1 CRISPR-associated protein (Cas_Cas02710) [Desulforamulus putei DSM 12395]